MEVGSIHDSNDQRGRMEKGCLLVARAGLSSVVGTCVSVANTRVESAPAGRWAVRQGMVYARRMRNERWNAAA